MRLPRSPWPRVTRPQHPAGECILCLPLIHRVVVEYNEKVLILVTVRCEDTLALLRSSLPDRVVVVRAPVDAPVPVGRFLDHWRPCICVMVTGWLPPTLILQTHRVRRRGPLSPSPLGAIRPPSQAADRRNGHKHPCPLATMSMASYTSSTQLPRCAARARNGASMQSER
jgi:3-Deoxy-D-manno-octulosonic-acid transferase (kdotransferase)